MPSVFFEQIKGKTIKVEAPKHLGWHAPVIHRFREGLVRTPTGFGAKFGIAG
jgi:hypothetical protein